MLVAHLETAGRQRCQDDLLIRRQLRRRVAQGHEPLGCNRRGEHDLPVSPQPRRHVLQGEAILRRRGEHVRLVTPCQHAMACSVKPVSARSSAAACSKAPPCCTTAMSTSARSARSYVSPLSVSDPLSVSATCLRDVSPLSDSAQCLCDVSLLSVSA